MAQCLNELIKQYDPTLCESIEAEASRQEDHLELIASENYASPRVMAVQGSMLTNKYAEGYPGRRYYGGCDYVDEVERLARQRAKELFNADYANVQPHSGSQANQAVYMALMQPGDTVLGMSLDQGGHLTHGAPVNFSGKLYNFVHYGVDPQTECLDYEQLASLAYEHRPKVIVGGFSAYSRIIDWQRLRDIADEVGAYLVVDMAHVAGLVATGLYPSPVQIADVTTSTTHKTLRGPRGGLILAKSNPELTKKISSAVFPGSQGGPLMHVIASKALAFYEALQPSFKTYQQQVIDNAKIMSSELERRGYDIVSGGTDNHLFLLSLKRQGLTGKAMEKHLENANITANKNTVPKETLSPFVTSGLRIGTAAMTTRGMGSEQAEQIANWIADLLDAPEDTDLETTIQNQVVRLCRQFPVYQSQQQD